MIACSETCPSSDQPEFMNLKLCQESRWITVNTECLSNEDARDLAVLGPYLLPKTPFLSRVVPAALCAHMEVSGKPWHKCFWRMFALSCSHLDLMFETASAWCASCYWQLVLQLCCHEAGLMILTGVHGDRWGCPGTEVESDYRTRSGPQQFKSRKFVGLSLPGKPLKYKCSWISVLSGLQTAFISRNLMQGQASYWCHMGPNKTQHWRGMKCHMELINITHQKIESTDSRIQTHFNK